MSMYFSGTFTPKNAKVTIKLNLLMNHWMKLQRKIEWTEAQPHGHFGNMLEGSKAPQDSVERQTILNELKQEQFMVNYELKELLTTNDFDVDSA